MDAVQKRRGGSAPYPDWEGEYMSELFPIFLKLRGLDALVVGGGAMAAVRVKTRQGTGP
jgi:hypothetical protein